MVIEADEQAHCSVVVELVLVAAKPSNDNGDDDDNDDHQHDVASTSS